MKRTRLVKTLQGMAVAGLLWQGTAYAQAPRGDGAAPMVPAPYANPGPAAPQFADQLFRTSAPQATSFAVSGQADAPTADCRTEAASCSCSTSSFYVGGDLMFVRPVFSTAIAFVRTTTTPVGAGATIQTTSSELGFDYDTSFRLFVGYQLNQAMSVQFTYWNLDTSVDVNGAPAAANQVIVDPFGNTAALGQSIGTRASVRMNVYDLDLTRRFAFELQNVYLDLDLLAGLRIADVDQAYAAQIMTGAGGAVASRGDFTQSFMGAGPRIGLGTTMGSKTFAFYANADMALLLGDLDIDTRVALPGIVADQTASRMRVLPVFGTEVGVVWRPGSALTLSLGWMFQAWFDLGTAGGTFGGRFVETFDSNIMAFDGLVARAKLTF